MLSTTKSICLQGLEGILINVEVDISSGMPCWEVVGLPDTNIKESKERVRTAIKNCGIDILSRKYIINLSPSTIKKNGAVLDLAIAVGILRSMGVIKNINLNDTIIIGELSLNGNLNKVDGILPICIEAVKYGIKRIILPEENAKEASIIGEIEVIGMRCLLDAIKFLNGHLKIKPEVYKNYCNDCLEYDIDFSEVRGHETIKRAIEVAAAGGHNCMFIGSPGTGKTMMAKRLPTILPDLTPQESLEITKIYSISGMLKDSKLVTRRPFRCPHYSISEKMLIGGGKIPKPGEISLAHLGVLYLDELLEFNKNTLELLRVPLEDKKISISRINGSTVFPCNFMLVASMNPCPCGYYGSKLHKCICTDKQIAKYKSKLSGPLLDRFDIQINVPQINYKKIDTYSENSYNMKRRVNIARKVQEKRYEKCSIYSNSELSPKLIEKYCKLDDKTSSFLINSLKKFKLSSRAYSKILKLSRTIADLENKENIEFEHVLEALQYRSFDKI